MTIDEKLVKYLESLARIELTEREEKKIGAELQEILTYMDKLNELDTTGVEAMSHSFPLTNVMRPDEVHPSVDNETILANAPHSQDGCFVVPKTVE